MKPIYYAFAFVFFFLFTSTVSAQKLKKMGVSVDRKTYDHGVVQFWQNPPAIFQLTNTGNEPFELLPVFSQEDLEVIYPEEPVVPGETIALSVYYYTANTGSFSRPFELFISTSAYPIKLTVKGSIKTISPDADIACPLGKPKASKDKQNIESQVIDAETGLPIPSASVQIVALQQKLKKGHTTNRDGLFVDKLPQGNYAIYIERPGYVPLETTFYLGPRMQRMRYALDPVPAPLEIPLSQRLTEEEEEELQYPAKGSDVEEIEETEEVVAEVIPVNRPIKEEVQPAPVRDVEEEVMEAPVEYPVTNREAQPKEKVEQPVRKEEKVVEQTVRSPIEDSVKQVNRGGDPNAKEEVEDPPRLAITKHTVPPEERYKIEGYDTPPTKEEPVADVPARERYPRRYERIVYERPKPINIRFIDTLTGKPVAGLKVAVEDPDGQKLKQGATSMFGNFAISTPGNQLVVFTEKRGYETQEQLLRLPSSPGKEVVVYIRPNDMPEPLVEKEEVERPKEVRPEADPLPETTKEEQKRKEDELLALQQEVARLQKENEELQNRPQLEEQPSAPQVEEPVESVTNVVDEPEIAEENDDVEKERASYWDIPERSESDKERDDQPQVKEEPTVEDWASPMTETGFVPNNIIFLIDVSYSMTKQNKMDVLQESMRVLVDVLRSKDQVAVIAYNQHVKVVLESVNSDDKTIIRAAIDSLQPNGLTYGVKGIQRAYEMAEKHYVAGGNNQIILATDGLFSESNQALNERQLNRLVRDKAQNEGIYLSVVGFGEDNEAEKRMIQLAENGEGGYVKMEEGKVSRIALSRNIKLRSKTGKTGW